MTAKKRSTSPGRRIAAPWDREVNADLIDLSRKRTIGSPLWGSGAFVRHIVFGFTEPVSYCGRHVGAISTSPMPTLIGAVCRACLRRWNSAMDLYNAEVDAKNAATVTGFRAQFVDLFEAGDLVEFRDLWTKTVTDHRALFTSLSDELGSRGIDVQGVLETVRVQLGEPEPFMFPSRQRDED
jgi:hypothetical protein